MLLFHYHLNHLLIHGFFWCSIIVSIFIVLFCSWDFHGRFFLASPPFYSPVILNCLVGFFILFSFSLLTFFQIITWNIMTRKHLLNFQDINLLQRKLQKNVLHWEPPPIVICETICINICIKLWISLRNVWFEIIPSKTKWTIRPILSRNTGLKCLMYTCIYCNCFGWYLFW